jgi:hypothetical protein
VSLPTSPRAAANAVSRVLTEVLGQDRFPVDVETVARELSQQWCPGSPITKIEGHKGVGRFEGALQLHPRGKYWRIKFNADRRPARVRFTIAHEFGHYALHRELRTMFECSESDVSGQTEIDIEREADAFASTLLMPLDDLRRQVDGQRFDFELVKHCADRYGVSLTAAARQCAEVSEQRVIVAIVRDGALSRSWSSERAYRSGAYLRSRSQVVEVPADSLAHHSRCNGIGASANLEACAWFPNEAAGTRLTEHTLVSQDHDSTMLLLVLPKPDQTLTEPEDAEDDLLESTSMRFERSGQRPA